MNEVNGYQIGPNYFNDSRSELQDKISQMKGRSHRNNIRVDGVTDEKRKTCKDCKKKVLEILKDELETEDLTIERAHRVK